MSYSKEKKRNKRWKCRLCNNDYKYRRDMLRHARVECGKEPSFLCNNCTYKSKRKYNLSLHMVNVHGQDRTGLLSK